MNHIGGIEGAAIVGSDYIHIVKLVFLLVGITEQICYCLGQFGLGLEDIGLTGIHATMPQDVDGAVIPVEECDGAIL